MKLVVIGGTGLIGSKVVQLLWAEGHEVVAASPASGVNTLTGEGLEEALAGASVVVDLTNSPSFEDAAVLHFFQTSGRNLLSAEAIAGVKHHVVLSVVGTDRMLESGYFRAKFAQENLVKASDVSYTIIRATQFYEFAGGIAKASARGETIHLSPVHLQPIASNDIARAVAEVATGHPVNGTIEVAGPERIGLDELVRRYLRANHDPREVVTDPGARYFGALLREGSLTPAGTAKICTTKFDGWLERSQLLKKRSGEEAMAH
jgi:uncharacterized protein YbjT (DUF2867 family)